jgi:hypothetical protein
MSLAALAARTILKKKCPGDFGLRRHVIVPPTALLFRCLATAAYRLTGHTFHESKENPPLELTPGHTD